ncbi:hypothetical protein [Paenibacillus sp. MMO-58]|uniref:hypothetical protein n=1 Tax=Paenibacillus sp. MMO-58 TaxID=3081290 RepID=UPI0030189B18
MKPTKERKFKIGDEVKWTNGNGVNMGRRTIIGFDTIGNENAYYIDPIDTPWFSIRESNLELWNPSKQKSKND